MTYLRDRYFVRYKFIEEKLTLDNVILGSFNINIIAVIIILVIFAMVHSAERYWRIGR